MPDLPTVVSVTEDAVTDAVKGYVPAIKATFMVGKHGPFTVRIPKEGFTAQALQDAMRAFALEVGLLTS